MSRRTPEHVAPTELEAPLLADADEPAATTVAIERDQEEPPGLGSLRAGSSVGSAGSVTFQDPPSVVQSGSHLNSRLNTGDSDRLTDGALASARSMLRAAAMQLGGVRTLNAAASRRGSSVLSGAPAAPDRVGCRRASPRCTAQHASNANPTLLATCNPLTARRHLTANR